jgi:hypothetical protein
MKHLALLALLALAACGSLGVQAHTLTLAYKAGDTFKYHFHVTSKQTAQMQAMSIPITLDMTADETVKVKSVDSAGVADLAISLGNLSVKTVTGGVTNTTSGMQENTVEIKIRPDGTLVGVDGNEITQGGPLAAVSGIGGGFFIAAVLPDHAVKVGDTWSKTYDQAPGASLPGSVHIVSNSKYLRDESVNGVNAAVVETKSTGSIDMTRASPSTATRPAAFSFQGTFNTDVTTWIDPSGHRVIKSHATGHDDLSIDLPSMSTGLETSPMVQGPVTATGDSTTDLTPA